LFDDGKRNRVNGNGKERNGEEKRRRNIRIFWLFTLRNRRKFGERKIELWREG